MNVASEHSTLTETAAQGGMTAVLSVLFYDILRQSTIWLLIGLILILSDLYFGIESSRKRGEKVRFSRAVRRTGNKICEYMCWILLSITLSIGFEADWVKYMIFGIIYGNELSSCIVNYFAARGKRIKFNLFAALSEKLGISELENIKIEDAECDKKHNLNNIDNGTSR